jgi:hypothetical protein
MIIGIRPAPYECATGSKKWVSGELRWSPPPVTNVYLLKVHYQETIDTDGNS